MFAAARKGEECLKNPETNISKTDIEQNPECRTNVRDAAESKNDNVSRETIIVNVGENDAVDCTGTFGTSGKNGNGGNNTKNKSVKHTHRVKDDAEKAAERRAMREKEHLERRKRDAERISKKARLDNYEYRVYDLGKDGSTDGNNAEEKTADNNAAPTFGELYKRFRENKLSAIESWYNAAYLYCNDKYYSSGVSVKGKFKNIYAHPGMWYKNASALWRHNKWSAAVALLDLVPTFERVGHFVLHKVTRAEARIKKALWRNFEYSHVAVKSIGKAVGYTVLYGASAACLVMCALSVGDAMKLSPMFELYVDGDYAGLVSSISQVETAENVFNESMSLNLGRSYRLDTTLKYVPTVAGESGEMLSQKDLNGVFEKCALEDMVEGYGLYIDGTLAGAVPYKSWIDSAIADSLENKRAALKKSGIDADNVTYYNNITVNAGTYPKTMMFTLAELRAMFGLPAASNSDLAYFSEQKYDTFVSEDGEQYRHELSEQKGNSSENGGTVVLSMPTGDSNNVPAYMTDLDNAPVFSDENTQNSAVLDVVVEQTLTEDVPIEYDTQKIDDPDLVEGRTKVITKGENGSKELTYSVGYVGNNEVKRTLISERVISEPITEVVNVGTRPMSEEEKRVASKGYYIWPHSGDKVSSGYGWRLNGSSNEFHKGIDICGEYGDDVVAADGGEVIFAGYDKSGYGESITIRHDDGTKTRYAHNSELYVEVGQKVAQGEVIAAMGKTGMATGVHVHFEIIVNGSVQNPYDYLPESW